MVHEYIMKVHSKLRKSHNTFGHSFGRDRKNKGKNINKKSLLRLVHHKKTHLPNTRLSLVPPHCVIPRYHRIIRSLQRALRRLLRRRASDHHRRPHQDYNTPPHLEQCQPYRTVCQCQLPGTDYCINFSPGGRNGWICIERCQSIEDGN